jgi:hypothetical protein
MGSLLAIGMALLAVIYVARQRTRTAGAAWQPVVEISAG